MAWLTDAPYFINFRWEESVTGVKVGKKRDEKEEDK